MKFSNAVLIFSLLSSVFFSQPQVMESNIIKEIQIEEERVIEVLDDSITINATEDSIFNIDGISLKPGIFNEQVIRVKRYLIEKGYAGIIQDYYYDNKTSEIVTKYKGANGLTSNGIIDKDTYQKINEDMKANKIIIPKLELKILGEIPEGKWIIINKSNNTLYYLNGNEILNKYPVATGKTPSLTPEGKFTIVTKYINPAWGGAGIYKPVPGGAPNNPLGRRWMGLSIKGGGTYGIHGNSDSNSIGRHVTLGCIRMFNEDIESFYDIIDYGTPVWIGREGQLMDFSISFIFEIYMDAAINIQQEVFK